MNLSFCALTRASVPAVCMSLSFCLGGCSITEPVEVITQEGQVLQGSTTAALSGGHFSVTDGKLRCGGTYNALDMSPVISIPATCSDGRTGIITASRDRSGTSGSGRINLSDGTVATFAFGTAVASLAPPPRPQSQPAQSQSDVSTPAADSSGDAPTGERSDGTIEVSLERRGGTFVVPVLFNDTITLKCTIDSGAADVSVPADVVLTLMRTGTLRSEDFLGFQTYTLADGSTTPSDTFRIRTLKVGDREIENVTGSVAKVEGSLLLGQSFLTRFRSWSIDNERGVLLLN